MGSQSSGRGVQRPSVAARLRYLVFGRAIPGALFAIFGLLQLGGIAASYRSAGHDDIFGLLDGPVRLSLYFLFCAIPVVIYMARPMPRGRDGSLPARTAALLGTTILLIVPRLDQGPLLVGPPGATPRPLLTATTPAAVFDVLSVLLALGTAVEVYALLHLRLSFSVIPEARNLVTTGPYAVVRHPLYASEITVATAFVLAGPRAVPAASLVVFVGLQYVRSRLEERVLRRTFPEYAEYARHTRRLIPYVW